MDFWRRFIRTRLLSSWSRWGLRVGRQQPIKVYYRGRQVGDYYADLIVEGLVIIELKSAEAMCEAHEAQLLNYLKATEIEVGLLLNFGLKPAFHRKIFANDKKRHRERPQPIDTQSV